MNIDSIINSKYEFKPTFLASIFFKKCKKSILIIEDDAIHFYYNNKLHIINLSEIENIEYEKYFFWNKIKIKTQKSDYYIIYGINIDDAKNIYKYILIKKIYYGYENIVNEVYSWICEVKNNKFYICERDYIKKYEISKEIMEQINIVGIKEYCISENSGKINTIFQSISEFVNLSRNFKDEYNNLFVKKEIDNYRNLFSRIETNPLTEEQKIAIVTNEDSTLVVASAGSGKTSMLVGKVAYILEKKLCSPEEILIFAFNRSAKEEIQQRIQDKVGVKCDIQTFHSFGLEVIAKSKHKKPSISKLAENEDKFRKEIQTIITELCHDSIIFDNITTYFREYFRPYTSLTQYKTTGDYYKANKKNKKTLSGEYVKSLEELEIADFLTLNSVKFIYESDYKYNTATENYRQYQPDFYLPDYDIYIEHFAINEDNTSPFENYIESIEWKRQIHARNKTIMIETCSYLKNYGMLTEYLYYKLKEYNVELHKITPEQFLEKSSEDISLFAKLNCTFLTLFKNTGYNIKDLLNKLHSCDYTDYNISRGKCFLSIFEHIYAKYENILKNSNAIDFNDMINTAVEELKAGYMYKHYKFLIVDEFQDISVGRASLIQAIQKIIPDIKLFCVGDDWQSIYKFAGSDISVMTNFSEYFGFYKRLDLTKTFRFHDKIAYIASTFIQKNDKQLKKQVDTFHKSNNTGVILFIPDEQSGHYLVNFAKEIANENLNSSIKVLVLGRYNYIENNIAYSELKKVAPNCIFEFSTVHRSKGSEADYVIILELSSGRFGFPSEYVDDSLLDLVLAKNDDFPFSEERRLFYVALTRAKKKIYIVAPQKTISPFFTELSTEFDNNYIEYRSSIVTNHLCSVCKTGLMIQRNGKNGIFYGCSNFPECTYTVDSCPFCSIGCFYNSNDGYYTCDKCGNKSEICPLCKSGFLVQKSGQYGLFWGCSNYRIKGCKFTRNIQWKNNSSVKYI